MTSTPSRQPVTVTLRRDLGLLDVTMIGIGAMIGSSIFVLIGVLTRDVGASILLVFALNAVVTIFTASSYAELGSSFPEAGGGYLWVKKALPHPAGFISGWLSWFGHTVACSFYALGFGTAVVWIVDSYHVGIFGIHSEVLIKMFAAAAILFFLAINYTGVGATGKTGTSMTMAQVLIIVFFVTFAVLYALDVTGLGLIEADVGSMIPMGSNFTALFMTMAFSMLAFEGYEIIVQCGEEVKNPRKNIPRAIFVSVAVAAVLYTIMAFACLANFSIPVIADQGKNAVFFTAHNLTPLLGVVTVFGAVLSAMAALNATVFSSSRVSFAMGRDGSLPKVFGRIHAVRRIPHNAILITGTVMLVVALFFPLDTVVASTSVVFLLLFMMANLASLRLTPRLTEMDVGYRSPLFPLFPVVGAISTFALAVSLLWLIPEAWYVTAVWLAIGLVASAFAKPAEEAESILVQKRIPQRPLSKEEIERYRVFLALENLGNLRLVEMAGLISRYFDGNLTINKIVEVPRAMPLEAISKDYIDELAAGLRKTMKVAPSTINVRPVVSVSYDVAGAILDQIKHEAANLLVVGWKGTRRRGGTILGRNLDRVVSEAPCDVAVIKTQRLKKSIENVLLVSGGYVETRKALLLALPIAREHGARIELLTVIADDKQVELAHGNADRLCKMAARAKVPTDVKFVRSKNLVDTILGRAQNADILVMGSAPQSMIERTMFGEVYDRIIRSADVPVLVLRTARTQKESPSSEAEEPREEVQDLE